MTDIKPLPLPEPYGYLRDLDGRLQMSIGPVRPADRAGGYATPWAAMYDPGRVRANVTHATAPLQAEIEALKSNLHEYRDAALKEHEYGQRMLNENGSLRARIERQKDLIESLRAELREAWSAVDSKAGWEWKKRAEQAEARAERLAEALRYAEAFISGAVPQLARDRDEAVNEVLPEIRKALRDHDQEGKDG